jgi:hypothetical protein
MTEEPMTIVTTGRAVQVRVHTLPDRFTAQVRFGFNVGFGLVCGATVAVGLIGLAMAAVLSVAGT